MKTAVNTKGYLARKDKQANAAAIRREGKNEIRVAVKNR